MAQTAYEQKLKTPPAVIISARREEESEFSKSASLAFGAQLQLTVLDCRTLEPVPGLLVKSITFESRSGKGRIAHAQTAQGLIHPAPPYPGAKNAWNQKRARQAKAFREIGDEIAAINAELNAEAQPSAERKQELIKERVAWEKKNKKSLKEARALAGIYATWSEWVRYVKAGLIALGEWDGDDGSGEVRNAVMDKAFLAVVKKAASGLGKKLGLPAAERNWHQIAGMIDAWFDGRYQTSASGVLHIPLPVNDAGDLRIEFQHVKLVKPDDVKTLDLTRANVSRVDYDERTAAGKDTPGSAEEISGWKLVQEKTEVRFCNHVKIRVPELEPKSVARHTALALVVCQPAWTPAKDARDYLLQTEDEEAAIAGGDPELKNGRGLQDGRPTLFVSTSRHRQGQYYGCWGRRGRKFGDYQMLGKNYYVVSAEGWNWSADGSDWEEKNPILRKVGGRKEKPAQRQAKLEKDGYVIPLAKRWFSVKHTELTWEEKLPAAPSSEEAQELLKKKFPDREDHQREYRVVRVARTESSSTPSVTSFKELQKLNEQGARTDEQRGRLERQYEHRRASEDAQVREKIQRDLSNSQVKWEWWLVRYRRFAGFDSKAAALARISYTVDNRYDRFIRGVRVEENGVMAEQFWVEQTNEFSLDRNKIGPFDTLEEAVKDLMVRNHAGIDIAGVDKESRVFAMVGGAASHNVHAGAGNCVKVNHALINDTIKQTQYLHCHESHAGNGALVKAGDIIATMGRTGNTTAESPTHVHIQCRGHGGESLDLSEPWGEDVPLGIDKRHAQVFPSNSLPKLLPCAADWGASGNRDATHACHCPVKTGSPNVRNTTPKTCWAIHDGLCPFKK